MSMFKIEKGIPQPQGGGRFSLYPWQELEVGDSFMVPNAKLSTIRCSVARQNVGDKNGKKFRAANVDGGVRVWRYQ